jgi:hypothetical protein
MQYWGMRTFAGGITAPDAFLQCRTYLSKKDLGGGGAKTFFPTKFKNPRFHFSKSDLREIWGEWIDPVAGCMYTLSVDRRHFFEKNRGQLLFDYKNLKTRNSFFKKRFQRGQEISYDQVTLVCMLDKSWRYKYIKRFSKKIRGRWDYFSGKRGWRIFSKKMRGEDFFSSRDGSKFIGYPGRDHRQGGEDFFSKKNRGAQTFFRKKLGGRRLFFEKN